MKLPAIFSSRKREVATLRGELSTLQKAFNLISPSGWRPIWDNYSGQWQQDVQVQWDSVLTFSAVFSCLRLISTDIGKMRLRLMMEDPKSEVLVETESPAFSPLLRKPNHYQTRIKFIEQWVQLKLLHGRFYALKSRDARGVVTELYGLDPLLVEPLVSETGAVFYRLRTDQARNLAGMFGPEVIVPAREIIHDVHMTPEHPLIGVGPIGACGLAATQGLKIQRNSTKFFGNMSRPGFVLTTEKTIKAETAAAIKAQWEANFGGDNYGRTAVIGDGLKPETFSLSPDDAQLIEQLRWTGEDVCRAFGVPAYKVGIGQMPAFNNIEALDRAYFSQCLQELVECIELLHDEGLELEGTGYCTKFDLEGLLRMDARTRAEVDKTEISAGILAPNEARKKRGLLPVPGGDSPLMQQQMFSLEALAKRDAKPDPFAAAAPKGPPPAAAPPGGKPPPPTAKVIDLNEAHRKALHRLEQELAA